MSKEVMGHSAYSVSEFLDMPNNPQPYLLEGLVYKRGKTVVVAKPKVGKSWLSLKMGHSVSLGEPLFNLNTVSASVLFIEFDRRFLREAIGNITRDQRSDNMYILPINPIPLNSDEGYEFLLAATQKFMPEDGSDLLVVIDHKSVCFAGTENDDAPNRLWIATLDKVEQANSGRISYIVNCQAPKTWRGDIVDLPIGSRILTAWADTVISLKKLNKETRNLELVSNYGEIEPITYTKDFLVVPTEKISDVKFSAVKALIEERLGEFTYPNISKKIEEASKIVGCGYQTAWNAYREIKEQIRLQAAVDRATAKDMGNQ